MVNIKGTVLLKNFFEKKGLVEKSLTLIYIIKRDLGFRFSIYRARIWCENLQNLLFDQKRDVSKRHQNQTKNPWISPKNVFEGL